MILTHSYCPTRLDEFTPSIKSVISPVTSMLKTSKCLTLLVVGESGSGKSTCLRAIVREVQPMAAPGDVLWTDGMRDLGNDRFRAAVYSFCQNRPGKISRKLVAIDDLDLFGSSMQHTLRIAMNRFSTKVDFIGTCTSFASIHDSIQSRVTMVRLPSMNVEELAQLTDHVCASEKVVITPGAREDILKRAHGNPKTLMCFMERFVLLNKLIDISDVEDADGGFVSPDMFDRFTHAAKSGHLEVTIDLAREIHGAGHSVVDILDAYAGFIKSSPNLTDPQKYIIIPIISSSIVSLDTACDDELYMIFFCNKLVQALTR